MKREFEKATCVVGIAAIATLIGMIIYIITSTTGYLASSSMNSIPIICTVVAIMLMIGIMFMNKKISVLVVDIGMFVVVGLLLYSFYQFVMERVSLAADVYFIPVNYPASEAIALHISIVGVVLYLIADIGMIVAAFFKRANEK